MSKSSNLKEELRAKVGGENDDGVGKVNSATAAVCQPTIVKELKQDRHNLGVRLLHLIQEDDSIRMAADCLGELTRRDQYSLAVSQ